MKRLCLIAALLLTATAAGASPWESVLTSDNTLWSVNTMASSKALDLLKRNGDETTVVRVPDTTDAAIESRGRVAWDSATRALFVLWRHGDDEVRLARLDPSGTWTQAVVARGSSYDALQIVLTRTRETTFVHAAWWADGEIAEYALLAFGGTELLSSFVVRLDELAKIYTAAGEEATGNGHPPLAMERSGEGVDVAYGAPRSSVITTVSIKPVQDGHNARMWRPSGKSGRRSDPAGLLSVTSAAVQSFIVDGKVVLYTPDARFRYVILQNGKWTPIRTLTLDEHLTSESLVRELRRSVQEHGAANDPASE